MKQFFNRLRAAWAKIMRFVVAGIAVIFLVCVSFNIMNLWRLQHLFVFSGVMLGTIFVAWFINGLLEDFHGRR